MTRKLSIPAGMQRCTEESVFVVTVEDGSHWHMCADHAQESVDPRLRRGATPRELTDWAPVRGVQCGTVGTR